MKVYKLKNEEMEVAEVSVTQRNDIDISINEELVAYIHNNAFWVRKKALHDNGLRLEIVDEIEKETDEEDK